MTWIHCGETLLDDQFECPQCGFSKGDWSVSKDATRVLRIGGWRGDAPAQAEVLRAAARKGAPLCPV